MGRRTGLTKQTFLLRSHNECLYKNIDLPESNDHQVRRIIHMALALTPLICYMKWGTDQSAFLFQAEYQILTQQKSSPGTFTHPLVLLPLIGQLVLLFTLFQKHPSNPLGTAGQLLLSPIVLLILVAGMLSLNIKMVFSTLPFIISSLFFYLNHRKKASS